jgi:hypothetical protein
MKLTKTNIVGARFHVTAVMVAMAALSAPKSPAFSPDDHLTAKLAGRKEAGVSNDATQSERVRGKASADLRETAQNFITAIKAGVPLDLLSYWSDRGVTFGVEGEPVSKAQFRRLVARRVDLFCFFFDTDCLRKEDEAARRRAGRKSEATHLYSYRDLLNKAKRTELQVSKRKEAGYELGDVTVQIENGANLLGNRQRELEFTFTLEHGVWKLANVIYN